VQARLDEIAFDAADAGVEVIADQYATRRARSRRAPARAEDLLIEIAEDLVSELAPDG
jgi:hypothetical protein